MSRAKRNRSYRLTKIHGQRSRDLPRNAEVAEVAEVEIDNPLGLEPGEKIRRLTFDPQRSAGAAAFASPDRRGAVSGRPRVLERLGKGRARAVDPSREYVDGARTREPVTEAQRKAVLRLNRIERELGADGGALVHEVLVQGMTTEQVGQRRGLRTQRWNDFSRRFRECLDRLALIYGFATEKKKPTAPMARMPLPGADDISSAIAAKYGVSRSN